MAAKKTTVLNLPEEELVHPGNRAWSGCGLSIIYRMGLKALGRDTILVVPPSCLTVLQGLYPIAATQLPCVNVTFASTAAAATGVLAALRARKKIHRWPPGRETGAPAISAYRPFQERASAARTSFSYAMTTRPT
ncbi:MAG: hypothetical protein ACOC0W_06085 [Desulfosalsimonas sp.]